MQYVDSYVFEWFCLHGKECRQNQLMCCRIGRYVGRVEFDQGRHAGIIVRLECSRTADAKVVRRYTSLSGSSRWI